jgi:hypothetical protein
MLGLQTCVGEQWGTCEDQVRAAAVDNCDPGDDANCNGVETEDCQCINGNTRPCGTALGNCREGTQTCEAGLWQECVGAIEPMSEDTCDPGDDSNCDGTPNEGCPCVDGESQLCGSDEGNCESGMQSCVNGAWAACLGGQSPAAGDSCDLGDDANCNGDVNDDCDCINGSTRLCGIDTGNCERGTQTCGGGRWGTCQGGITAQPMDGCQPGDDANCNGQANENCGCIIGTTQTCGRCGIQTCTGSGWGTCSNQGVCTAGATEQQLDVCEGGCTNRTRSRSCTAQCTWGSYGSWSSQCYYEPEQSLTCYTGDVYHVDSCNVRGGKAEECNTASCSAGECYRNCSGALTFDDPVFENIMRNYAGKASGPLYAADFAEYPSIIYQGYAGINGLGGIECLSAVEILHIPHNNVSDLSPIRNASANLWTVFVDNNPNVNDLSPLVDNPNISNVNVQSTSVSCANQASNIAAIRARPDGQVLTDCP